MKHAHTLSAIKKDFLAHHLLFHPFTNIQELPFGSFPREGIVRFHGSDEQANLVVRPVRRQRGFEVRAEVKEEALAAARADEQPSAQEDEAALLEQQREREQKQRHEKEEEERKSGERRQARARVEAEAAAAAEAKARAETEAARAREAVVSKAPSLSDTEGSGEWGLSSAGIPVEANRPAAVQPGVVSGVTPQRPKRTSRPVSGTQTPISSSVSNSGGKALL